MRIDILIRAIGWTLALLLVASCGDDEATIPPRRAPAHAVQSVDAGLDQEVIDAVRNGDETLLASLFARDGDPQASSDGYHALGMACYGKDAAVVELLLDWGASVDRPGPGGFGAIHAAVEGDAEEAAKIAVLDLLLEFGANIDAVSEEGVTALFIAQIQRNEAVAAFLRTKGAKHSLASATIAGDVAAVNRLLGENADVNARVLGDTPLIYAAREGNEDIVRRLLTAGADPSLTTETGGAGGTTFTVTAKAVAQAQLRLAEAAKSPSMVVPNRERLAGKAEAYWNIVQLLEAASGSATPPEDR